MKIFPSFPLLNKELTEQANRKRTYLLRVVMVATMGISLVIFLLSSLSKVKQIGYDPFVMEKISNGILVITIVCQVLAILVLLPISMATSITVEKERNSLELLLLTRMKPWTIIFQKYFSRLIPIFMFLFLSLPMIAIAYSFGGCDFKNVKYIIIGLCFLIFYIGAWAIMWSSFCRTSSGAVILTYITLALNLFIFWILLPPWWYYSYSRYQNRFEIYFVKWYWVQAILTLILLPLSVIFLKTRIHPKRRDFFLVFLHKLDAFWKVINNRFGGIEFVESTNCNLPEMNPIQWYEKYKRPAGRIHYLFRIVLLISIPSLGIGIFSCIAYNSYYIGEYISMALLIFSSIFLILKSAAIVDNERKNQTLNVLLTTSVDPKIIVKSKMKTLFKLRVAISIPILMSLFMIHYFRLTSGGYYNQPIFYILLTYVFIHLSFISWFSCWIGLKVKKYYQAILIIFITVSLWFIIPLITVLLNFTERRRFYGSSGGSMSLNLGNSISYISPIYMFTIPSSNILYLLLYTPGILYILYWTRKFKTRLKSFIMFGVYFILWCLVPLLPMLKYIKLDYRIDGSRIYDILSYISPLTPLFENRWNFLYIPFVLSSAIVFLLYLHFRFLSVVNAEKYFRD